jgi:hypothetical protein
MATILDKDLTRESTLKYDDREIQVTLTADQQISFKLKGMKSGVLSIGIDTLYKQLRGNDEPVVEAPKSSSVSVKKRVDDGSSPMISLNRLRSLSLVTHMDFKVKLELERVICELLNKEIKLTEE